MSDKLSIIFHVFPAYARGKYVLSMGREYEMIETPERGVYLITDDVGQELKVAPASLTQNYTVVNHRLKWVHRFLGLAAHIGSWSKDPSTKVGAILVRPEDRAIVATGYNGFDPGSDDHPRFYNDREHKYKHIVHAEVNAINFLDSRCEGLSLYTSFPCCPDCVRAAADAGVRHIVHPPLPTEGRTREWIEEWETRMVDSGRIAAEREVTLEVIPNE